MAVLKNVTPRRDNVGSDVTCDNNDKKSDKDNKVTRRKSYSYFNYHTQGLNLLENYVRVLR